MKRITLILMAIIMALTLLGCATVKPGGQEPKDTDEPSAVVSDEPAIVSDDPGTQETPGADVPAAKPSNPSESFSAYTTAKTAAFERMTNKIEGNDDLSLTVGMSMFSVTLIDLALMPLTALVGEGSEMALEMLGMNGVQITANGNEYSITYEDQEGNKFIQTCIYDPVTDSMQSSMSDGTNEKMFFEYVRTGNGYASQYYYGNDDGTYSTMTTFFNDTDTVAYGIISSSERPASIIGNNSLTADFVKNGESYCILQADTMTLFNNGEEKTY